MALLPKDREWMTLALRLARRGFPAPNPHVGAVLVKKGKLIGQGFHPYAGAPHAERFALDSASQSSRGADIYVTLEPCSHYGRTPPCALALIEAGIRRVLIATLDPNPKVAGQGIRMLQEAGIAVEILPSEDDLVQKARQLNEIFFIYHEQKRPFITLKAAVSMDGKIAAKSGDSKWITGERARRYAHRLRAEHNAVVVGIGTVLKDDPQLTARLSGVENQPLRVVMDSRLRIPEKAKILNIEDAPTLIVCCHGDPKKIERLQKRGVQIWEQYDGKLVSAQDLVHKLYKRGISGILVEGGGRIIASFLEAGLGDKVAFFYGPLLMGGANAPTAVEGTGVDLVQQAWRLKDVRRRALGEDWLVEGYLVHAHKE